MKAKPADREFYAAIGDTLAMVGKFDRAQEFFRKAYASNGNSLSFNFAGM